MTIHGMVMCTWYPINKKHFICEQSYLNMVENKFDKTVKSLRTDRGREYLSDQFQRLYDEK